MAQKVARQAALPVPHPARAWTLLEPLRHMRPKIRQALPIGPIIGGVVGLVVAVVISVIAMGCIKGLRAGAGAAQARPPSSRAPNFLCFPIPAAPRLRFGNVEMVPEVVQAVLVGQATPVVGGRRPRQWHHHYYRAGGDPETRARSEWQHQDAVHEAAKQLGIRLATGQSAKYRHSACRLWRVRVAIDSVCGATHVFRVCGDPIGASSYEDRPMTSVFSFVYLTSGCNKFNSAVSCKYLFTTVR